MRIILGIGNPGAAYQHTRHNCGFAVVDELARRHHLGEWRERWQSLTVEWRSAPGTGPALLLKPQTFVNGSGQAALAALSYLKVPLTDLLVVVDDLNLPLGSLRLRSEGSAGGHNGLRDIEGHLGIGYARLRVGISQPATSAQDQVGFVLGRFSASEEEDVRSMVAKAADCVTVWLTGGIDAAMRFNGPLRPPVERTPKPLQAPSAVQRPTSRSDADTSAPNLGPDADPGRLPEATSDPL